MIELSNIIIFLVFTGILTGVERFVYRMPYALKLSNIGVNALFSSIITIVWNVL